MAVPANVQDQVTGVLASMLHLRLSDVPSAATGALLPSVSTAEPADSASAMPAKTNRALASALPNPSFHSSKPAMVEAATLHKGVAPDAAGREESSSKDPNDMDATAAGEGCTPDAAQASAWNTAVDTAIQHEGVQKEMRVLDAAGVSCHLLTVACCHLCSALLFRARLRADGVLRGHPCRCFVPRHCAARCFARS